MDGGPPPEPDSVSSSGFEVAPGPYREGPDVDVISVGRPPLFRVPRVLRFGLMAVCGVVVLGWVALTLKPDEAESPERPTFAVDMTSYQPARGNLVADLISSVDGPVYIDDIGLFRGDSAGTSTREFAQWGWAQATVVPASVASDLDETNVRQWPTLTPLTSVPVLGDGGRAVLGLSVRPPCGDRGLPKSAHVVIWYHTDTDEFRQTIPDLLDIGSPTSLQLMKRAVCRREHQHSPKRVEFVPGGGVGRHWLTVDGVRLSYRAPAKGWERFGDVSLNKSLVGPQGAEGIVYWSGYPDGVYTDWCSRLSNIAREPTTADLAAALASTPGTKLVAGPSNVTVGGRNATHLVLYVDDDRGCDPGYFYTWNDVLGGALWPETVPGDTIRVWLVKVDGLRLFIAGETHSLDGLPRHLAAKFRRGVEQVVESIRLG